MTNEPAQWWVINQISRPGGVRGPQQTNYVVVQSAIQPVNSVAGPFANQLEAENWRNRANAYGNSPASAAAQTAKDATQAVANAVPGLSQIGKFFNDLSQASTWIRIGEVLAGLLLIAVGVARITHAVPVATAIAKKVGTKGLA